MSTLDAPDAAAVAHAVYPAASVLYGALSKIGFFLQVQLLQDIGAMDQEQMLSPLGYHLAKLPVPPKVQNIRAMLLQSTLKLGRLEKCFFGASCCVA